MAYSAVGRCRCLQTFIGVLRRALEPERPARAPSSILITERGGYRLRVDEDAAGWDGRPDRLLHGFPQTHLMWRDVAADLMTDHTVICPDLRGYGDSDKPAATDETVYSKRTMANDVWRGRSGTRGSRSSVTTREHS